MRRFVFLLSLVAALENGDHGGLEVLQGGRCWFNCPNWKEAREAIQKIRYTGAERASLHVDIRFFCGVT